MHRLYGRKMAALLCLAFATLAYSHGPPFGPPGFVGGTGGGTGSGTGTGADGSTFGGGNNPFGGGASGENGNGFGNGFGGNGANGGNGAGGFPGANFLGFDINTASYFRRLHGILCGLAMVILFPLGSILMRVIPGRFAIWIHALFQFVAMAIYIAGAGLGIYLITYVTIPFGGGSLISNSSTNYHPIIGIITLAALLPQPLLGLLHHRRFKRVRRRQVWSYAHLFNGRVGITIGIINGGLGLQISNASPYYKRVYIIVAAVMWSLWMLVAIVSEVLRARRSRKDASAAVAAGAAAGPAMTGAKNIPPGLRRSDSRSERSRPSLPSDRQRSRSPPRSPSPLSSSGRRSRDGPPRN